MIQAVNRPVEMAEVPAARDELLQCGRSHLGHRPAENTDLKILMMRMSGHMGKALSQGLDAISAARTALLLLH